MLALANIRALINAMEFDGLLDKNCHTHTVAFSCLMQPIMCALERATAIVCVVGGGGGGRGSSPRVSELCARQHGLDLLRAAWNEHDVSHVRGLLGSGGRPSICARRAAAASRAAAAAACGIRRGEHIRARDGRATDSLL